MKKYIFTETQVKKIVDQMINESNTIKESKKVVEPKKTVTKNKKS